MEISDVVKIRSLLRKITRIKEVYKKGTNESVGTKEVSYPISIEFDNSAALSEECDVVMWNDKDGLVVGLTANNGQVRGSNLAIGHSKPINPGVVFVADYGEIQQMRMVVDKNGMEKLMKAVLDNGNFIINKDAKEVKVTAADSNTAVAFICNSSDSSIMMPVSAQYDK